LTLRAAHITHDELPRANQFQGLSIIESMISRVMSIYKLRGHLIVPGDRIDASHVMSTFTGKVEPQTGHR